MYRHGNDGIEVLLVHPGGPFWCNRDVGAWSIPKGEHDGGEDAESAARREFEEALGVGVHGLVVSLGEVRQRAGKIVRGHALAGDLDVRGIRCNDVAIEWPPRSGRTMHFPEIDRAAWFALPLAVKRLSQASGRFSIVLKRFRTILQGGTVGRHDLNLLQLSAA